MSLCSLFGFFYLYTCVRVVYVCIDWHVAVKCVCVCVFVTKVYVAVQFVSRCVFVIGVGLCVCVFPAYGIHVSGVEATDTGCDLLACVYCLRVEMFHTVV